MTTKPASKTELNDAFTAFQAQFTKFAKPVSREASKRKPVISREVMFALQKLRNTVEATTERESEVTTKLHEALTLLRDKKIMKEALEVTQRDVGYNIAIRYVSDKLVKPLKAILRPLEKLFPAPAPSVS